MSGWFTSSYSDNGSGCVEVRFDGEAVLVRDSKYLRDTANDPAVQPVIAYHSIEWSAFIDGVRAGEFDPNTWHP